jgi:hypothetical protein
MHSLTLSANNGIGGIGGGGGGIGGGCGGGSGSVDSMGDNGAGGGIELAASDGFSTARTGLTEEESSVSGGVSNNRGKNKTDNNDNDDDENDNADDTSSKVDNDHHAEQHDATNSSRGGRYAATGADAMRNLSSVSPCSTFIVRAIGVDSMSFVNPSTVGDRITLRGTIKCVCVSCVRDRACVIKCVLRA